ncbi:hypothetical protein HanHA300_Chr05g0173081 [Helianthus annuus]|nr:hypothetical protein HanHA300_Chr05g0173081 [Helianthus annuus]KAJ0584332.1 hypothetical protein HanHA89_Chr05g0187341 [Helianthus annuus]KAJ0750018.1 hypothetical protein HanLR1_Chr05g0176961 [Helianthus annuus]
MLAKKALYCLRRYLLAWKHDMSLRPFEAISPYTHSRSPFASENRIILSKHTISAWFSRRKSMPTMTSKLPSCISIRSIGKM